LLVKNSYHTFQKAVGQVGIISLNRRLSGGLHHLYLQRCYINVLIPPWRCRIKPPFHSNYRALCIHHLGRHRTQTAAGQPLHGSAPDAKGADPYIHFTKSCDVPTNTMRMYPMLQFVIDTNQYNFVTFYSIKRTFQCPHWKVKVAWTAI